MNTEQEFKDAHKDDKNWGVMSHDMVYGYNAWTKMTLEEAEAHKEDMRICGKQSLKIIYIF